jgi:hypothetical protein
VARHGLWLAGGCIAAAQAFAQPALTAVERRWIDAGAPVLAEAVRLRLPLDVVVQPQPNAGEPVLAMAYADGRCRLVLTMRGPQGAPLPADEVDPAPAATVVEAMFAHELGHCWRRLRELDRPGAARPAAAFDAAAGAEAAAARREEGFADLVALAWTLRRDPAGYPALHAWLAARRASVPEGDEHDTREWLERARDPRAFGTAGTVFEQAERLWPSPGER